MTDVNPLAVPWYAKPNDLIGGWCVMPADATPGEANVPEVADFTSQEAAEYIAEIHNRDISGLSALAEYATAAIPPRLAKVLDLAEREGWQLNPPGCTIVLRLDRPTDRLEYESLKDWQARGSALPFYIGWGLFTDKNTGKRSWRFTGARAANGQALSWTDVPTYLANPEVIYPNPPEGTQ